MLRRHASVAATACLLALCWTAAGAFAAVTPTETYQQALAQIDAGKVTRATINRTTHDVRLLLSDGTKALVVYPPSDEATLSATLHQHGATVKFTRHTHKQATTHHRIRYIAGGVLLALIVVGGGLYLYSRRSQEAPPSEQPPAGGTAAGDGDPPPAADA